MSEESKKDNIDQSIDQNKKKLKDLAKLYCSKCNSYLSLDHFHKSTKKERGYQSWCKKCIRNHTQKRKDIYKSNHEKKYSKNSNVLTSRSLVFDHGKELRIRGLIINKIGRQCTKCKRFLSWSNFSLLKKSAFGYNTVCKDCIYEITITRYEKPRKQLKMRCELCGSYKLQSSYAKDSKLCPDCVVEQENKKIVMDVHHNDITSTQVKLNNKKDANLNFFGRLIKRFIFKK